MTTPRTCSTCGGDPLPDATTWCPSCGAFVRPAGRSGGSCLSFRRVAVVGALLLLLTVLGLRRFPSLLHTPAPPQVVTFDWTWTFEDDLTADELATKEAIARAWQARLWEIGEGNFALGRLTIRDRVLGSDVRGEIHTPLGLKNAAKLGARWGRVRGGRMELPGDCNPITFVHELGHLAFGCPDEDDDVEHHCACIMAATEWSTTAWCDERTHRSLSPPCWEGYILKRYPSARHPGPGGPVPALRIELDDR